MEIDSPQGGKGQLLALLGGGHLDDIDTPFFDNIDDEKIFNKYVGIPHLKDVRTSHSSKYLLKHLLEMSTCRVLFVP